MGVAKGGGSGRRVVEGAGWAWMGVGVVGGGGGDDGGRRRDGGRWVVKGGGGGKTQREWVEWWLG